MLLLALASVASVALAQDTGLHADPDSPSPLIARSDTCSHGVVRLAELRDHLVPPRNRAVVVVELEQETLAHSARPGLNAARRIERAVQVYQAGRTEETTWWQIHSGERDAGREDAPVRSVAMTAGGLKTKGRRTPSEDLRLRLTHCAAFPHVVIGWLSDHGHVVDVITHGDRTDVLVDVPGGRVLVRTVTLDHDGVETPGLVGFDWWIHDVLLGDFVESLDYEPRRGPEPGVAFGWRIDSPLGTHEVARITEVGDSPSRRPIFGCPPSLGFPSARDVEVEVIQVARDVLELRLPEHEARSLAIDLDIGWVVLEAPVASHIGEALIAALEKERPGHPIAYVAVSHHHPHYIGALRPFVHRGATIVCPAEVERYVEHVISRPRTLHPDRLSRSGRPVEIVGVGRGEHWSIPGLERRLVAVEADGRSAHTDAFLVFLLPDVRLGFGGDLLWVPVDPDVRRRSERTEGLAAVVEDSGVPIDDFLTSWPVTCERVGGLVWRDRVTIEELRTFVAAGSR